jgi:hypothetical protein
MVSSRTINTEAEDSLPMRRWQSHDAESAFSSMPGAYCVVRRIFGPVRGRR